MHRPAVHLALQLIALLAFALLVFHVMLLDALLRKHFSAACRMSDILAEPVKTFMHRTLCIVWASYCGLAQAHGCAA